MIGLTFLIKVLRTEYTSSLPDYLLNACHTASVARVWWWEGVLLPSSPTAAFFDGSELFLSARSRLGNETAPDRPKAASAHVGFTGQ